MNNNYTNKNYSSSDAMSWAIVIICLVAFWPLGLILLLKKINFKKNAASYSNFDPAQRPSQSQQGSARPGQTTYGQPTQTAYKPQQAYRPAAQNQAQQSGAPFSPPRAQQNYYAQGQPSAGKNTGQKNKKEKEKKQPGKGLAAFLTFLGVLFSVTGVACVASGASIAVTSGITSNALVTLLIGVFFSLGGVISFLSRIGIMARLRRWNKYSAILGEREVMSVSDMSESSGISPKKLRKELIEIADLGYFGESAYFDSGLDSICLSSSAAEKARTEQSRAADAASDKSSSSENQYVAIINELHILGCNTSDPSICAKIQRIEDITAKIFKIVEEKPEKMPQNRRFMNYYLPTTLKLLYSYQTLEKQGINGENIMSAKQDIERVLETLSIGFEQQLDNLFKTDKMDISADIDVLENMMEQDGLTNEGNMFRTAGGN